MFTRWTVISPNFIFLKDKILKRVAIGKIIAMMYAVIMGISFPNKNILPARIANIELIRNIIEMYIEVRINSFSKKDFFFNIELPP